MRPLHFRCECLLLFYSNLLDEVFDLEYDGLGLNEKKQLTKKFWSSVCFAFGNAPLHFRCECLLLFYSNHLDVVFDLEYDGLGLNEKKQLTKKLWSSVCFAFGNAPTSF